ncbi:uncharacterized protein G2W53_035025 [Senna tora]|uniref:Uncharacterized protein n=1 Tax=Senna tora TaxID=362788 RepID=A0A834W3K9_9FABA|nr:uncharacterized protein G2W53_035025 [Senna tora]
MHRGHKVTQTETNPKHNANAITLGSEKKLEDIPAKLRRGHTLETEADTKPEAELEVSNQHDHQQKEGKQFPPAELIAQLPFSERFAKSRKEREEKEIMDTSRRVEVNILLLDAIQQIPRSVVYPEGVLEDVLVQLTERDALKTILNMNIDKNSLSTLKQEFNVDIKLEELRNEAYDSAKIY